MTTRTARFPASLLLLALPLFAAEPTPAPTVPVDPPAAQGSLYPALAVEGPTTVSREHELLLSWLEPDGALRFSRHSSQGWTPPVTVAQPVALLEAADGASLTVLETHGVRRTLLAHLGDVVARSGDGGRAWTRLPSPPLPFASFAGGEEGGYAFWLGRAPEDPAARLLGTRLLAGETLLDPQATPGSPTSAAMSWDGPVVVYRRGAAGKELAVVRRADARWSEPQALPVGPVGPSRAAAGAPQIVAHERRVAIAWAAQAGTGGRPQVSFSSDAGATFAPPVELPGPPGGGKLVGTVGLALDETGTAWVSWRTQGDGATVRLWLARVAPDGRSSEPFALARTVEEGPGAPVQLALAGEQLAAAWVEGTPRRIRTALLARDALPPLRAPSATPAPRPSAAPLSRGRVGEPAPALSLPTLAGGTASLAGLRGKAVLLNLWATWCLPCVAEMPELASLHQSYDAAGLVVVGVNVDDEANAGKIRPFVEKLRLPFAIWLDPTASAATALRSQSLPTSVLIDRKGRIVWRRDGPLRASEAEVQNAVKLALEAP